MHFYVDESGHTGPNLFDPAQPILYYGVLSSRVNLDVVLIDRIKKIRHRFGVPYLHAAELGVGGLCNVVPQLLPMVKAWDLRFDVYLVAKADHAIICFFDQVFDQGVNPAVTWTGYWTPIRYVLLLKVAALFDEDLAKLAWEARITPREDIALPMMQRVCEALLERVERLPDARSRQVINDALKWAEENPKEISYNVSNKKAMLDVTPNVVGFQAVMHGIATRLRNTKSQASRVVVDQQSQFNKAQRTLAELYRNAKGNKFSLGPGLPIHDHTYVPDVPLEFCSSTKSCGLELVDIHLWVFKRYLEGDALPKELASLVAAHARRSKMNEISLNAIARRWSPWFNELPQQDDFSPEQLARAREILLIDETRRMHAVSKSRVPPLGGPSDVSASK
ncbi:Protein of unknown function [Paraburkholderia steynii]|uniref:DUF3800 domain-containing protein n=1 Tax=Paraburkholderia steynii TaxID=1245441 RepID=A0A7Z7FF79_9BURK|nr:DUF3800 domain-containing protein [Paraburkholderia steynii]SDH24017.1 Protein of unknown function [Paraburkholderia steynii]